MGEPRADAFTGTARAKIEAAGGFVQVLAPAPGKRTAEASTPDDATQVAAAGNDGAPQAADETPEVPQASSKDDARDDAESGSATE